MGTYGRAGLAQGLSSGLMGMGSMLLDVQVRNDQRAFREYQIKMNAQDRQDRLDDMEAERKSRDAATFRVAQAAEMAERKRQDEAIQSATMKAQDEVRKLQAEGRTGATLVPREGVSGWMGQIPTIDYGPQPSFEQTPAGREAKYFIDRGFTPTGARIPTPEPPPGPKIKGISGRDFPDTPQGRMEALEWQKLMDDAKQRSAERGGAGAAPTGMMDLGGRIGGLDLGGGGAESPVTLPPPEQAAPVRPRAFAGEPPAAPVAAVPAAPSELEQDIMAALSEGETPEKILSDMEAAGVPQEMMTQAAEILRNRAR